MLHLLFIESSSSKFHWIQIRKQLSFLPIHCIFFLFCEFNKIWKDFESKHWHNRPVLQHHNNNPKHPVQNHLQFMIFFYPTLSWEPCEMIILFNFSFELLTLLFSSTTNLSLSYYITFICYSSVHFILPLAHLGRLSMYLRARVGLQAAAYPTAISADCKLQRIYVCDCIGPVFRLICLSPLVF